MEKFAKPILFQFIFLLLMLALPFGFCLAQTDGGKVNLEAAGEPAKLSSQPGQPPAKSGIVPEEKDKLKEDTAANEIESYLTFLPSAKSKDGNSRISIIEADFEYAYEHKLFDRIPLTFSLSSEYINLGENSQLNLPAHLTGLSAGVDVVLPFFNLDKTYLNLGVSPSTYRDDWAFESSSFRMPANAFLIYRPDDKWVFVGGLAFFPDFKDKFFPVAGFVYKPNEKFIFNITTDDPGIVYSLNDKLTVFTQMELPLGAEFEVKRADLENMVLIYNDMRLGLGIGYKINKFASVSIAGGGVFNRYLKYKDGAEKLSLENSGYIEFSVGVQI